MRLYMATLLAGLCLGGTALAQQTATVSETDAKQVVNKFAQAWDDAYNSDKPAGIAALFTSNGIFVTPAGTILRDHKQMEQALEARIKAGWTKESVNLIEAHVVGDDVIALVSFSITGSGPNAGKQIGGYSTNWFVRDGSDWRVRWLLANLKPVQDVTGMAAAAPKQ